MTESNTAICMLLTPSKPELLNWEEKWGSKLLRDHRTKEI
jgi:hypothetical protein